MLKKYSIVVVLVIVLCVVTACGKGTEPSTETNQKTDNVPEELKNSEYNLTKVLSEKPLKDVFSKYFSVGTAINGNAVENTSLRSPELAAILKYHFNSLTYSNLMKPCYLLDEAECKKAAKEGTQSEVRVTFDSCKEGLDFAFKNDIKMRGHVLVWHNQVPGWFFCKDYDDSKGAIDKETMLLRLENYIKQVLAFVQKEYPGVIYAWDVVNEAVEVEEGQYDKSTGWNTRTSYDGGPNLWYDTIGPEYVEKAFEYARKYTADGVSLMYNDYNTFDSVKCEKICVLLKDLKAKGLVDGIGMQSAMQLDYPNITSGIGSVKEAIKAYSELGLEIHMSEITMRCDGSSQEVQQQQADRYEKLFQVILAMDKEGGGPANIQNVTFFGLMDNYLMYEDNEDCYWLLDNKLRPKLSFYSIQKALETKDTIFSD